MPELLYRVHSVTHGTQMQELMFEGAPVQAAIPNMVVELAWDVKDGRDHGSLTLKFVGTDMAWAKETFVQDGQVEVSFTPVAAPAPE